MPKRNVFYSFHYDKDAMRVQLVKQIGTLDGNEPVSSNRWEEIKRSGDSAIKRWIDENMVNRTCLVVLIGQETYSRQWVKYEIEKAWRDGKGVVGIYIHNLKCARTGICSQGPNPFDYVTIPSGQRMSSVVTSHNPSFLDAYGNIRSNLDSWVEAAIQNRSLYR